jgi:hypothetical protein
LAGLQKTEGIEKKKKKMRGRGGVEKKLYPFEVGSIPRYNTALGVIPADANKIISHRNFSFLLPFCILFFSTIFFFF